jgi:hypothetical protein
VEDYMGQYERAKENKGDARFRRKEVASQYSSQDEFVNVTLTEEQQAALRVWRATGENVDTAWQEALEDGYKFTLKWDEGNNCVVAFMFPQPGSENTGYILTGRAGSGFNALASVLFKHTALLRREWAGSEFRDLRRVRLEE